MLKHDRQTLADHVSSEGALGLREGACCGLVRYATGHALVERPHVPFELCIWIGKILVRQDFGGEWAVGCISNEAVDAVGEPLIGALEGVG